MNWKQLKSLREQRADKIKAAEALLTAAETEKRSLTADEQKQFDALHTEADSFRAQIENGERQLDATGSLERRSATVRSKVAGQGIDTPGAGKKSDADGVATDEVEEQRAEAFENWVRRGEVADEMRDLVTNDGPSGGYTIPSQVSQNIVLLLKNTDAFRRAGATVITDTISGPYDVPYLDDESQHGGTAGEGQDAGEGDPTFGRARLQDFRYDSKTIPVTEQMLMRGNLEPVLYSVMAQRIGEAQQDAFTNGDGDGKPLGLLNGASVGASGNTLGYDQLADAYYSVQQQYRSRPGVSWMMNDNTLSAVRKIKDTQGRPIFNSDPTGGSPDTIFGKPVTVNYAMPDPVSGAKPIAFGDFGTFYVREVGGVRIKRDPFTRQSKDEVAFDAFANAGAGLTDRKAIKLLKLN